MERVLTQEERIRRAEEIYLRRRSAKPQYRDYKTSANDGKESKEINVVLFKRMILQIVICLLLYCIFYLIYDTNYSFSGVTLDKTKEILNYDVNFTEIYNNITNKVINFINKDNNFQETDSETNSEEGVAENNEQEDLSQNELNQENIQVQEVSDIPVEEENEDVQQVSANESSLKDKYSLIVPVNRWICNI